MAIGQNNKFSFTETGDISNGNYFLVGKDGVPVLKGDATLWNDISFLPLLVQRVGAANNPTLSPFIGNVQQLTFAVGDYVYVNFELTHEYKEGSNITLHTHWATNGTDVTDRFIKWEFEYTISNGAFFTTPLDEVFPSTTIVSQESTIPANTPSLVHVITALGTIPASEIQIGAYVLGRFRRIASAGTAPTANPFGLNMGSHVEIDTHGSREIATK